MKTIEEAVAKVAIDGRAWLSDLASAIGLSKSDVAEIARVRGLSLRRVDLVAMFDDDEPTQRRMFASETKLMGVATIHYVEVMK